MMKVITNALMLTIIFITNLNGQGIPYGQEFQVNTQTKKAQSDPSVAVLKDGNFVICWVSEEATSSFTNIIGQCFDAAGNKKNTEFMVNTQKQRTLFHPTAAALENGGFVICWDGEASYLDFNVYFEIFDLYGNKLGNETQVTIAKNPQSSSLVIGLKDGGFVLVWVDWIFDPYRGWIFVQKYDNSGVKMGDEFRLWDDNYNRSSSPNLAELNDGGFIVCWGATCKNFASNFIFGQLFNRNGEKQGNYFSIISDPYHLQSLPKISVLTDSNYVVCWQGSQADGSGTGLWGQIFNLAGKKLGNQFHINTYEVDDQFNLSSTTLADGGFVVCWESKGQDGSGNGIFGQLFDASGNKKYQEFRVNSYTKNSQSNPAVAALADGGFLVVWDSDGQDGDGTGIFCKAFSAEPTTHKLQNFSLLSPANHATLDTTRFDLRWQQPSPIQKCYSWEISYTLYIDTTANFSSPKIISAIVDTTYHVALKAGKTYYWKVKAKNHAGDSLWSQQKDWKFVISPNATSVTIPSHGSPQQFALYQNYPNPFNQETQIRFQLPVASYTVLKIFNTLGQEIQTIVDQQCEAGYHTVRWDGRDNHGNLVGSGTYLYQIKAGEFVAIKKLVFLK